jgi:diaminohydroxyphosphoribosylaminopyrimidine deaminase/5-amino-6-(5-phosphoribosylamino)uracil reductase
VTDHSTADDAVVETAMRRALELAARGPSRGANPQVGCVLLRPDGSTAAEGWHRGAGTPHAEVDALARLGGEDAEGLTAVVTLEPCDHTGRTGPCSVALITAGVARVVYAVDDPGDESSGGGARLLEAGVAVEGGVLVDEATELVRRWLVPARHHRPFVTVKWASSLDGRAAAADGTSRWITGTAARQHVHEVRAAHDAILVGTGTVLADDDRAVPEGAGVLRHPRELVRVAGHDPAAALDELWRRGVRSVLVEGGPTVASAFVRAGLADDYLIYLAPTLIGGVRTALDDLGVGTIDEQRRLRVADVTSLGTDLLIVARDDTRSTP